MSLEIAPPLTDFVMLLIRCNDTLPICDIHNKQHSPCCGQDLFDPVPFYSVAGTCFRSVQLKEGTVGVSNIGCESDHVRKEVLLSKISFTSLVNLCFRWSPIAEDMALSIRSVRFTMFMNHTDSPGGWI